MRVLVLGGTRFLGRAVVEAALGRGDEVTLFNRGQSNPELYPGLEEIVGDRAGDLTALSSRSWDAVIDVAAYDPDLVSRSVRALADRTRHYAFVSTVSVYADHGVRQVEGAPVLELRDDTAPDDLYGARKAAAERIVTEAFGDRALIGRAGLIVGPNDPTDPVQCIDVRDLAGWFVDGCHRGRSGAFNVTGEPMPFGDLLRDCRTI